MKALWTYCEPLPASELGARLCKTFNYTWNAILKVNETLEPWQTVTKYPLKPRVLWRFYQDAGYLVGVRFDDTTQYALIDIDWLSPYHPQQSADGIRRIQAALETVGICRTVCTRSSDSKGIHLWIPLEASVPTFWLATALKVCLETHGLTVKQGELETFPNCKAYAKPGEFSDYQGHRLPLQPASGALLLDETLGAVPGGLAEFFRQWDWAATGQDLSLLTEAIALTKTLKRHRRYRSGSAVVAEWRRDLETEITEGWTDYGQTNHLLKTIACYGVVFQALSSERLTQYVLDTVERLPGYFQWCRHQHEIKDKAEGWAKIAEGYYWALGTQGTRTTQLYIAVPSNEIKPFNGNQRRATDARERIQAAVVSLSSTDQLPTGVTARADAIVSLARCSNQTLHKYKALWHPDHLNSQSANSAATLLTEGSVCTTDQAGDRGEIDGQAEKVPKRSNTDQMGLIHTLPQHMKGVVLKRALTEKNTKFRVGGFLQWRKKRLESQRVDRTVEAAPITGLVTDPPAVSVPQPPVNATPQPPVRHPNHQHPTPRSRGGDGLTGLGGLLQSFQPQTVKGTCPVEPRVPLPSDPLPSDLPPATAEEAPAKPPVERPRRRPVKSGIDPQRLPDNATYMAPPPVQPAIAPAELWGVTAAVQTLLQRLQVECQWTAATVQEWIAQHFDGRRRSELADHELPLLLERLQSYWQQQSGGGEPQAES